MWRPVTTKRNTILTKKKTHQNKKVKAHSAASVISLCAWTPQTPALVYLKMCMHVLQDFAAVN